MEFHGEMTGYKLKNKPVGQGETEKVIEVQITVVYSEHLHSGLGPLYGFPVTGELEMTQGSLGLSNSGE